jgi:ankyrin repeat protein
MMLRGILISIGVLLLPTASGLAQAPARTSIAVYAIRAKGKADVSLGPAMTSLLITNLSESPRLKVIEEEMLKVVMERQAMNTSDLCDSTQCQVEIGKLVQAQKMVVGELLKLGESYILTLRITDIQAGTVDTSIKRECRCTEEQLPELATQAAAAIRQYYGETGLAVPATPQAPLSPTLPSKSATPPPRSYLGVEIQEVTPGLAKTMKLKEAQGVLVVAVSAGSPAEKGGIAKGDILLQFAGQPLRQTADLSAITANYGVGRSTEVRLWRNGQQLTRTVTLEPIPEQFKIFAAANRGETDTVAALLNRQPDLVNSRKSNGGTPLHSAAGLGNAALVRLLLDRGADVNAGDQNGWTPLHGAVYSRSRETVELLLARGASVKAKYRNDTADGITPLHLAASQGDREMAEVLLAHGAEINAKAGNGATPLHDAANSGSLETVELLIERGAEVNAKYKNANADGITPLHIAAAKGSAEVAGALLAHGAEVDARARNGATPLHDAANAGSAAVAEVLLTHGAEVNAKAQSGTPLALALARKHPEVAEVLRRHGGKRN